MRGPTSKGKEREERVEEQKGRGRGRVKASEAKKLASPGINFWLRHCLVAMVYPYLFSRVVLFMSIMIKPNLYLMFLVFLLMALNSL